MQIKEVRTEDFKAAEVDIQLRIVQKLNINVNKIVSEDYKPLKDIVNEEQRLKFLEDLEKTFDSHDGGDTMTDGGIENSGDILVGKLAGWWLVFLINF